MGTVIQLTPTHQAGVEDKPEVRKAGVYYTPAYIVGYNVKQTAGKAIDNNARANVHSPLPKTFRVLGMACGSGPFLLGAYQFLLDYYLRWYTEHDPEKFRILALVEQMLELHKLLHAANSKTGRELYQRQSMILRFVDTEGISATDAQIDALLYESP